MLAPPRTVIRREAGMYAIEQALRRRGFDRIAGADEAGRGACAGPLVVAACSLPPGRRGEVPGLADSKLLTAATRDRVYDEVVARASAYAVVIVDSPDVDHRGVHAANIDGMRRAVGLLDPEPQYVLTDGFRVDGFCAPALAVPKGDRVVACIAAASVLAKVTRDRLMLQLHEVWPQYDFARHKGYITAEHTAALAEHGACEIHRSSFVNVSTLKGSQRHVSIAVSDDVQLEGVLAE
jgi:ribonuclease HII